MIQLGRYDCFDKWEIVRRSWAGEIIDAGLTRWGDPCILEWATAAIDGGRRACGIRSAYADIPANLKQSFELGALYALRYTEDVGEIPDLEMVRYKQRPFPVEAIRGKRNVLDIFCAAHYGIVDVIHVHDARPDHVTLVDNHPEHMGVMRRIYPPEWTYVTADYKEFLREAADKRLSWDLIVADPWSGMCQEVAFDTLPEIMARTTDMFICHYLEEMFTELGAAPDDRDAVARAIKHRTGVDVVVAGSVSRGTNCDLVMRRPQ